LEIIVELACSSSKQIRSATLPLVKKQAIKSLPFLENIAAKGSAESRFLAVKHLHELSGDKSFEFLNKRLELEKPRNFVN
jgi:hypothetical protein